MLQSTRAPSEVPTANLLQSREIATAFNDRRSTKIDSGGPASIFQTRTPSSFCPALTILPSLHAATDTTLLRWPICVVRTFQSDEPQIVSVLSSLPVIRYFPSNENDNDRTGPSCLSSPITLALLRSQISTESPALVVAITAASGEKADRPHVTLSRRKLRQELAGADVPKFDRTHRISCASHLRA